jgi:hypothetical protein
MIWSQAAGRLKNLSKELFGLRPLSFPSPGHPEFGFILMTDKGLPLRCETKMIWILKIFKGIVRKFSGVLIRFC